MAGGVAFLKRRGPGARKKERNHQKLQPHGAGDGATQRIHPVQVRHTRVPRRGGGDEVQLPTVYWQAEFQSPRALRGRPHGRDRGQRRRRDQDRQEELDLLRAVIGPERKPVRARTGFWVAFAASAWPSQAKPGYALVRALEEEQNG